MPEATRSRSFRSMIPAARWLLIAMLMLQVLAWGQSEKPSRAEQWHRRAWERHQAVALTDTERLALEDFDRDPSRGPSDQVRRVMSRYQPSLSMMQRAVQGPAPERSVGDDQSHSAFPTFDQLTSAWRLSQGLRRDLLIRLHDDDAYGALEKVNTLFRLVEQTAAARTLPSSLLAADLLNLADAQIDVALDHQVMGPPEASALLAIIKRLNRDDPLQFVPGVQHEADTMRQWLTSSFTGDDALATFQREFGSVNEVSPASDDNQTPALTQTDLESLVERSAEVLSLAEAAFALRDEDEARETLTGLEKKARAELGPFAGVMRITRQAYDRAAGARQQVWRRTQQLQSIADGSLDPASLANAAVWYIRATVAMDQLREAERDAIRRYAVDHAQAADPEVTRALESAKPVLEQLARGAGFKRCDFVFARPLWPTTLRHYHSGLRDAARVLHADAARLIHEQKYADAAERLAVGYRLADHLHQDRSLAASLVAFEIFRQTDDLVAAAMDARWFEPPSLELLGKAVEPISDVDAFGFARAGSDARSSLAFWLKGQPGRNDPKEVAASAPIKSRLETMPAERLLWLGLIRDAMNREARFNDRNLAEEMFALRDVIPMESIRDTMLQAEAVELLIEGGLDEELAGVEMPTLPNVSKLASAANRQVRAARDRLEPDRRIER